MKDEREKRWRIEDAWRAGQGGKAGEPLKEREKEHLARISKGISIPLQGSKMIT